MSRKKATKSRISKTNARPAVCLSEKLENDFRAFPTKLPALFSKDLDGLKKQESKLQSSLQKMQKQQTVAKNKHAALTSKSKNNLTAAAKKQINAAKKALEAINEASLKCSAQLDALKQHGKLLSQKQAKFSAICKYIATLDKEWEKKNAKSSKPKKAKAAVKIAKPKKQRKAAKPALDEAAQVMLNKIESEMNKETVEASS